MATSLEPLKGGYDVDENAVRFSNYFHLLRELVHLSCGWLPLEPRLETKYALGDHLHDDARTVTKIKRRLYELRTPSDYPGAPAEELAALLDRANRATTSTEYVEIAYGEWTSDGRLRHPVYLGERTDVDPAAVVRPPLPA